MTTRRPPSTLTATALLAVAALTLGACGDDEGADGAFGDVTTTVASDGAAGGSFDEALGAEVVAHYADGVYHSYDTTLTAAEELQAHGVSAMPVMGPLDHRDDPHLAARGALVDLVHPEVGPERHTGNPMVAARPVFRTAPEAPCLCAHTHDILTGVLGLSAADVDRLVASGVCR